MQDEPALTGVGRSEPIIVEMIRDDMWLEVICLANLEIAGSPRNIFRYSPEQLAWGVELWMDLGGVSYQIQSNFKYPLPYLRSQSDPAKRSGPEGNIPDRQLRSLNEP